MASAQPKLPPLMDVAEFIAWPGDGTSMRYELVDGVLRAMAPSSDAHNMIQSNLNGLLWLHITRNRPGCRVVANPGVQPRLLADWNFRISDLGVTFSPNAPGVLMTPDPLLLIEILSPSNAAETRESIRAHATLPTITELAVVHSTRIKAEVMRRDEKGAWPERAEIVEAGGLLRFASIEGEFRIEDAYAGTHLAPA